MMKFVVLLSLILGSVTVWADNFAASEAATYVLMNDLKITPGTNPQNVEVKVESAETSDTLRVSIQHEKMPNVRLTLRGPKGFYQKQDRSLQTAFIAAGFFTGSDASQLLGEIPNTVFVGFDYPYQISEIIQDPAKLLQTLRLTPGQIALSLKWLSTQAWVNPQRLSAIGVSMGGLYLPAALHMAQKMNVTISKSVFAFTGADLKIILGNTLKGFVPAQILPMVSAAIPAVNTLSNPELHLPYLQGSFLVIYSDQDQVIPRSTSETLFNLLPQPKKQQVLNGPHVDIDQPGIIQQLKATALTWLQE